MDRKTICVAQWVALAAAPLAVYGFSSGPPAMRTGAAVDGGLNCTACHRTFAADSGRGRITIAAEPYRPGMRQNIVVTVSDPEAMRWGFQLTARLGSDPARQAGTFTVNENTRVRCQDGRDAPCAGGIEFASHTSASTRPGTTGSGSFTVEWTPPAEDAGEIVLYAAGNAANNNNTSAGDQIYTTSAVVRPACFLDQTPSISGISDAAAYRPAISSNTLISIFGANFAGAAHRFNAVGSDLVSGKLPTEFGCVAVEIAGRRAPVFYVQRNQVNAQAPILDVTGAVDVRVIVNPGTSRERRSDAARVQFDRLTPAFFVFDGTRSIKARHADGTVVADPAVVPGATPAKPGETIELYGTGFGFSDPVWQPGEFPDQPSRLSSPVTLTVGGAAVTPTYAGVSGIPGLYQVNVVVPEVTDGNAAVVLRVGGVEAAAATIPVRR